LIQTIPFTFHGNDLNKTLKVEKKTLRVDGETLKVEKKSLGLEENQTYPSGFQGWKSFGGAWYCLNDYGITIYKAKPSRLEKKP